MFTSQNTEKNPCFGGTFWCWLHFYPGFSQRAQSGVQEPSFPHFSIITTLCSWLDVSHGVIGLPEHGRGDQIFPQPNPIHANPIYSPYLRQPHAFPHQFSPTIGVCTASRGYQVTPRYLQRRTSWRSSLGKPPEQICFNSCHLASAGPSGPQKAD